MGFNKKAKQEAAAEQKAAYASQQAAYQKAQADAQAYQSTSNTRNAGVIGVRDNANSFLTKFNKGDDISTLIPSYLKVGQQASDTTKATLQAASAMGDASQLPKDQGYQAKLNSVTSRSLGRSLAATNEGVLTDEVGNQTNNLFNSTNFLNADAQAGLNLDAQNFGMTNTIWNNATARRSMEIQVGQQAMGNLMGFVQLGLGAATGLFGAGGIMSGLKGGSSSGGGFTVPSAPSTGMFHTPFNGGFNYKGGS